MAMYYSTKATCWSQLEVSSGLRSEAKRRVRVESSTPQFAVYRSIDGDVPVLVAEYARKSEAETAAIMLSKESTRETIRLWETQSILRIVTHFVMTPQGVSWLHNEEEELLETLITRFGG